MATETFISNSLEETRAAGALLAHAAKSGDVYGLSGTLGAGKTEFVRGFVAALDPGAEVRSPTFSLVNTYRTPIWPVHHFDFYRLKSALELREIGFDDYIYSESVCLIEWAELAQKALPPYTRWIRLSDNGDGVRVIEIDTLI